MVIRWGYLEIYLKLVKLVLYLTNFGASLLIIEICFRKQHLSFCFKALNIQVKFLLHFFDLQLFFRNFSLIILIVFLEFLHKFFQVGNILLYWLYFPQNLDFIFLNLLALLQEKSKLWLIFYWLFLCDSKFLL